MTETPLQEVERRFGSKAQLVSAIDELATDELWVDRVNKVKGLASVPNRKLLRLHDTLTKVGEEFGSRAALIDRLCQLDKRDADYRNSLNGKPLPLLWDMYAAARKRAEASKPKKPKKRRARSKKAKAKGPLVRGIFAGMQSASYCRQLLGMCAKLALDPKWWDCGCEELVRSERERNELHRNATDVFDGFAELNANDISTPRSDPTRQLVELWRALKVEDLPSKTMLQSVRNSRLGLLRRLCVELAEAYPGKQADAEVENALRAIRRRFTSAQS